MLETLLQRRFDWGLGRFRNADHESELDERPIFSAPFRSRFCSHQSDDRLRDLPIHSLRHLCIYHALAAFFARVQSNGLEIYGLGKIPIPFKTLYRLANGGARAARADLPLHRLPL